MSAAMELVGFGGTDVMIPGRESLVLPAWMERFLSKTVRLPPHEDQEIGCLWWTAGRSRGGGPRAQGEYGTFFLNRRLNAVRAHVAMATAMGIIEDFKVPQGLNLDHCCNRSLCVEHTHLDLISAAENNRLQRLRPRRPLTELEMEIIRYRGVRG